MSCPNEATWYIQGPGGPYDYTYVCDQHKDAFEQVGAWECDPGFLCCYCGEVVADGDSDLQ